MVFVCIKSVRKAKLALEFLVQYMYNIYILFMIIGINVYKFQKRRVMLWTMIFLVL